MLRYDAVGQILEGDSVSKLSASLNYITPVSNESTAIEQQMIPDFDKLLPCQTFFVPARHTNA